MQKANKIIRLPFRLQKPILALGGQSKNTICFAHGDWAELSSLHLDLSQLKDFLEFEKSVRYYLKKKPKIIAYDAHPGYLSSKYIQRIPASGLLFTSIQHHHAHIAACLVENAIKRQKVIGVAFDGTGMGSDRLLWGSEFLICDYKSFSRAAHLMNIPLLGAEKAILEPWRLAFAWLYLIYKEEFLKLKINFFKGIKTKNLSILKKMYSARFNAPLVSSMGRLFDAVASLVLSRYQVSREAELAIALENIASGKTKGNAAYRFKINRKGDLYILDPSLLFKQIIRDLQAKTSDGEIASRFHLSIARMICQVCILLRKNTSINTVVLSGGVFQNNLLLTLSLDLLYKQGFNVLRHRKFLSNDSNISLGQVAIAHFQH